MSVPSMPNCVRDMTSSDSSALDSWTSSQDVWNWCCGVTAWTDELGFVSMESTLPSPLPSPFQVMVKYKNRVDVGGVGVRNPTLSNYEASSRTSLDYMS